MTPAWPRRPWAGICHDHSDCEGDALLGARCRGFALEVPKVDPPEWPDAPDDVAEFRAHLIRMEREYDWPTQYMQHVYSFGPSGLHLRRNQEARATAASAAWPTWGQPGATLGGFSPPPSAMEAGR